MLLSLNATRKGLEKSRNLLMRTMEVRKSWLDVDQIKSHSPTSWIGSGPTRRRRGPTEEQVANKRFQNVIGMLHSQISQHRNGNIFHNPIKASEAPDYRDIVKRPMDLKTIKARIKDGVISNSLEFQRDVYLMFANSMMYNRPDSDIYTMAEEVCFAPFPWRLILTILHQMMLESEGHINAFRQTEGLIGGHVVSRSAR